MAPPEPLKRGYDVDENAIRFSNSFHVLRELVHLSAGWLPHEPSFERKYELGDHLHDDARAISKVKRRLYELRHPSDYPGAPGWELVALLDRIGGTTSPGDYIAIAYGEAKPALLQAFGIHLRELDPVSDEPSLRLLRKLAERQQRHIRELGQYAKSKWKAPGTNGLDDLGSLGIELKAKPRKLRVMRPLDEPARDEFVEVTPDG